MAKERIPQTDVLAWLQQNHPNLHTVAVIDRSWIWLPVDLRGKEKEPIRKSIHTFGFRFAGKGHALTNGQTGTWSHSCEKPMPYRGKGKSKAVTTTSVTTTHNVVSERVDAGQKENESTNDSSLEEALAFVNSGYP